MAGLPVLELSPHAHPANKKLDPVLPSCLSGLRAGAPSGLAELPLWPRRALLWTGNQSVQNDLPQASSCSRGPRLCKRSAPNTAEVRLTSLQLASAVKEVFRVEHEARAKLEDDVLAQLHDDVKATILSGWSRSARPRTVPAVLFSSRRAVGRGIGDLSKPGPLSLVPAEPQGTWCAEPSASHTLQEAIVIAGPLKPQLPPPSCNVSFFSDANGRVVAPTAQPTPPTQATQATHATRATQATAATPETTPAPAPAATASPTPATHGTAATEAAPATPETLITETFTTTAANLETVETRTISQALLGTPEYGSTEVYVGVPEPESDSAPQDSKEEDDPGVRGGASSVAGDSGSEDMAESDDQLSVLRGSSHIGSPTGRPGMLHGAGGLTDMRLGEEDEDEDLEVLQAKAEQEALDQTVSPNFVLVGAEKEIMELAVAAARKEMKEEATVVHVQDGRRKGSLVPKTKGHAETMLSFVPNTVRRCIRRQLINLKQRKVLMEPPLTSWYDPVLSRFPAAVVFADASGFTKLTESLARQPHGAEQIGETLNGFFGPLIEIIHRHHGDVIKFSGDALTIIWAAAEPAPRPEDASGESGPVGRHFMEQQAQQRAVAAVAAAARCCLEVQREIPNFGQTPVPGCLLTMHIGVGFGELALLQIGGLMGRWEFCVAGEALDQIAIAEPLAASGETVFSPQARALVEDRFAFEEVHSEALAAGTAGMAGASGPANGLPGFARLLGPLQDSQDEELDWWRVEQPFGLDLRLVTRYIPSAVAIRLACSPDADKITYPEEMRRLSVVFVSISGLEPHRRAPRDNKTMLSGGHEAQLLMRLIQRSVYALEGSVNKFLVDDKGALMLIAFGLPPLVHFADDPVRAVLCAMRVCDTLRDEDLVGRVGVATGMCWCGVVGSEKCREYTVLGDVVNLSARLMGKAPENSVLVDTETQSVASRVLDFEDGGELTLKGKQHPTRAYRFRGLRRGLARHRKEPQPCLMEWDMWPARGALQRALHQHEQRSGVVFIRGPGGAGKTELAEEVRAWAQSRGWNLLAGQNLDPSGIFALPRLCLQEAFRELVRIAGRDDLWRAEAWKLLLASLGADDVAPEKPPEGGLEGVDGVSVAGSTSSCEPQFRRGAPTHAELYWLLVAMLRTALGGEAAAALERWAPLLSLVVTQLAFGAGMVAAMLERDEQHPRRNRFAEICAAVVDGFSRRGAMRGGTALLLHYRCSSAVFGSRDDKEGAAVRAIAELCVRRRAAAPQGEPRPLLLVVVARDGALKESDQLARWAEEGGGLVDVDDLGPEDTARFVAHALVQRQAPAGGSRSRPASAMSEVVRRMSMLHKSTHGKPACPESGNPPVSVPTLPMQVSFAGQQGPSTSVDTNILAEYVFEVTGGNPFGVLTLLQELENQEVLVPRAGSSALTLTPSCQDVEWLRRRVKAPEALLAMAFSVFERTDPKAQMVLKAASTFERDFGLFELGAALGDIMGPEELNNICKKLSDPRVHTLRKVPGTAAPAAGGRRASMNPPAQESPGRRIPANAGALHLSVPGPPGPAGPAGPPGAPSPSSSKGGLLSVGGGTSGNTLAAPSDGGRRLSRRHSHIVQDRFMFYSLLLRHVASTLVLESQRSKLNKKKSESALESFSSSEEEESSSASSDSDLDSS